MIVTSWPRRAVGLGLTSTTARAPFGGRLAAAGADTAGVGAEAAPVSAANAPIGPRPTAPATATVRLAPATAVITLLVIVLLREGSPVLPRAGIDR
ncbi:hypothetical protein GCM10022419_071470 [Nonomuraea rosea]|uniref:Uncharacterized protein n=1 Tax=Nonomuraea rosea TaxID=638574 RepID=A0ABP6Y9M3_9ACTN